MYARCMCCHESPSASISPCRDGLGKEPLCACTLAMAGTGASGAQAAAARPTQDLGGSCGGPAEGGKRAWETRDQGQVTWRRGREGLQLSLEWGPWLSGWDAGSSERDQRTQQQSRELDLCACKHAYASTASAVTACKRMVPLTCGRTAARRACWRGTAGGHRRPQRTPVMQSTGSAGSAVGWRLGSIGGRVREPPGALEHIVPLMYSD